MKNLAGILAKTVVSGIKQNRLVFWSIVVVFLMSAAIIGMLFLAEYTFQKEEEVIATRHYGDIVITTKLTIDGNDILLDCQSFNESLPYTDGQKSVAKLEGIETLIKEKEWCESLSRRLRNEAYGAYGALIFEDFDIGIDFCGVDLEELIEFDYSFKDWDKLKEPPERGVLLSEWTVNQIEEARGEDLQPGELIKVSGQDINGKAGDPGNIAVFYLEYLGMIPDTGGGLRNSTEERFNRAVAYVDFKSMERLFKLNPAYANNWEKISKEKMIHKLNMNHYQDFSVSRMHVSDNAGAIPNQIYIRVKDGTSMENALSELNLMLAEYDGKLLNRLLQEIEELNEESQEENQMNWSFQHIAMPSIDFLKLGKYQFSTENIVAEQRDKIRSSSLLLLGLALVTICEFFYVIDLKDRPLLMRFREFGANRIWVLRYVAFRTCIYIVPAGVLGVIAGIILGRLWIKSQIGIVIIGFIPLLWGFVSVLLFSMLVSIVIAVSNLGKSLKGGES